MSWKKSLAILIYLHDAVRPSGISALAEVSVSWRKKIFEK